jgi:hypothetical protein
LLLVTAARLSFAQPTAIPASQAQSNVQQTFLTPGKKQKMLFTIRSLGSVKGQVFVAGPDRTTDQNGVSGVKVTLRSRDAPFKHWSSEQYTDGNGNYVYENLRPGEYTVEIDPPDLPGSVSTANVPLLNDGTLEGTVFIDRNRNGKYEPEKDISVKGAVITASDVVTKSDAFGRYKLANVPFGRIGIVVQWPDRLENTHLSLDLASSTVPRKVDIHPIH